MKVAIYNTQNFKIIAKKNIEKIVTILLKKEGMCIDEIGVHFINKKRSAIMHKKYYESLFNLHSLLSNQTFLQNQ